MLAAAIVQENRRMLNPCEGALQSRLGLIARTQPHPEARYVTQMSQSREVPLHALSVSSLSTVR